MPRLTPGNKLTFISYCGQDQDLAQKLKEDLTRAGCDPWQFDLSATPGTDAWGAILEPIEKSDFLIVILSKAATTSRAVTKRKSSTRTIAQSTIQSDDRE